MEITIKTPKNFSFRRTVMSHGWCVLPPFEFDKTAWSLIRVLGDDETMPITVTISAVGNDLKVATSGRVGKSASEEIIRHVRHIFRLDDDMNQFYRDISDEPEFAWIAAEGAGRLLRSPTVFEDLVKMICTTNCSWSLTTTMVRALVTHLGTPAAGHQDEPLANAFPMIRHVVA